MYVCTVSFHRRLGRLLSREYKLAVKLELNGDRVIEVQPAAYVLLMVADLTSQTR